MPNYIKVTTVDANHIKVEFRDYYPDNYPIDVAFYNRGAIQKVEVFDNEVMVTLLKGVQWDLSDTGADGVFQIDDIDGTTTWVDLETLAAQIATLIVV